MIPKTTPFWNKPHQSWEVVGCLVSSNIGPSNCRYAPYMIKLFIDRECVWGPWTTLLTWETVPIKIHVQAYTKLWLYITLIKKKIIIWIYLLFENWMVLHLSKLNSPSYNVIFAPRLIEIGNVVLWRKILKCGNVFSNILLLSPSEMFATFRLFEFKSLLSKDVLWQFWLIWKKFTDINVNVF